MRGDGSRQVAYWSLVLLVLLLALFFRTWKLDTVPSGLDGDEMFNGWDAGRVWKGKLFVYFPSNYGREPLLIYLIALTTRLLGTGAWTIRLASVVGGIVGLAFTWVLARRLFNLRVAVLTTGLMAVSLWPILISRVALRAGLQPVCQVAAVYALWRGWEEGSRRWTAVGGLFTGLSLYTYTASRVFPLVLMLWLPVLYLSCAAARAWRTWLLGGIIAGLVALPLGFFAFQHPEIFNQRVNALDLELDQLRAGDPEAIWRSSVTTLRMFTQTGDREWRYNYSGRPVFDWVTGSLFYLGLLLSLARWRRPAYSLMLVWLPVMLVPTVLSIGTPSFLRAVGALTPVYLMPAIGADFIYERIALRVPRLAPRILGFAAFAGLALVGGDTWRDFFGVWASNPQVLHTYEADLAAAARYLNSYTPADTPVWVSSDYPGDLSRRVLALQSKYPGPVRWFDGNYVTVWPSGWAGRDVLLIFTHSSPPNPDALAVLSDYLIYREEDAAGRPHLWVYRIPGASLSESPWRPAHARSGRFARNREILGYDAPAQVQRQSEATVIVYWRVPPGVEYDVNDLPWSFVCLRDATVERCLDEPTAHYGVYPVWDWTVGDVIAQRYTVSVPAYLMPQTTTFHVGMFNSVGEISFADENAAGAPLLVGPVEVVGTASAEPQWDEDTPIFGGDLALVEYRMPDALAPVSTLVTGLRWQAVRAMESDYAVHLELRERSGEVVAVSAKALLGSERHPTSRWADGEPAHTFHKVQIPPDLGNGELDVYLVLSRNDDFTTLLLGTLSVSGRPHYFELPEPEYPLVADFGDSIRLLGFDLDEMNPTGGGQIQVVLYWQALDVMVEDYKVFVHLYHPTIPGGLPGQHDSPPGNGAFPTSGWLPGEVVRDPHLVPIEANADTGLSKLGVGLYLPATGERLPVRVDGEMQADNVLILTEIEVR